VRDERHRAAGAVERSVCVVGAPPNSRSARSACLWLAATGLLSAYHSKYNPVERVWGVLEQHWNGSLLDSRQTVLRLASTMTYHGLSPLVKFIDHSYQTGIRLSQQAMSALERRLDRLPLLGKWFVRIVPQW
jgi:hypothetical protein